MREVAAEREKPALLFSGGKDSIVLVRLAQKAFAPGQRPVPAAAHRHRAQLPRGHRVPRPPRRRARARAARRLRAGVDRRRPRARGDRPARLAQPPADDDAAGRDRRARARRLLRRRPPRRGARPRQGARAELPRRLRPVGPAPPAPRAVGPLQRARPPRREHPRVPDLQLDRARRLAVHRPGGARAAVDLHGPRARGLRARRDALRGQPEFIDADGRRGAVHRVRALPHGRRHELHGRGALHRAHAARRSSPRSPRRTSPSAARRAPTTARPRPRWKTASARATSSHGPSPPRHRRQRRRRQVDADRAPAVRRQGGPRRPARARRGAHASTGSTSRCSPTACAPSASRASRSTSPTAPSPRRSGASSSPTAPATRSTRATWSPAPRPPTSRCCWSTPAPGLTEQIAPARRRSPRCCGSAT